MAITLAKLCVNAQSAYGMKLIAGETGMDNFVRWVHMIEDKEVPNFLHGNELVFTTGIAQMEGEWLLGFVTSLLEKNASGLVVNVGPYVEAVPAEVIEFCDRHNLPLFTVPWKSRLIDITYDFCHRIVASEEIEVGLATAFRNLIFMPQDEKIYKPTLERHCFYPESRYCVVAFGLIVQNDIVLSEGELKTLQLHVQRLLNKSSRLFSLFFHDKNMIVILHEFNEIQTDAFIESLQNMSEAHGARYKLLAGVSALGTGYQYVPDAYRKAVMALRVARLSNQKRVRYQNMGIYKLLVSVAESSILQEIYEESLGVLEKFDKSNNTDYMDTLRCYLENDSSVQNVAQVTFVHRNTVNYKLRRIRQILGCDFTYENKLKFMLAFFIRDLL